MFSLIVLSRDALDLFAQEHPWLALPDISEVSVFLDEEGFAARLTAVRWTADGCRAVSADTLGAESLFALAKFASRFGEPRAVQDGQEDDVWNILDELNAAGPDTALRMQLLEKAYQIVRSLSAERYQEQIEAASDPARRTALEESCRCLPATLAEVGLEDKRLFLEVQSWRLAAILRDEMLLGPAMPHQDPLAAPPLQPERTYFTDRVPSAIMDVLFDLSPVAFSISTIGFDSSRYVRVNQAYLDLVGVSWSEIRGSEMISAGLVLPDSARQRRLDLLNSVGSYHGEQAEIRDSKGNMVRVLISARRLLVGGQLYDFEALSPVTVNVSTAGMG